MCKCQKNKDLSITKAKIELFHSVFRNEENMFLKEFKLIALLTYSESLFQSKGSNYNSQQQPTTFGSFKHLL